MSADQPIIRRETRYTNGRHVVIALEPCGKGDALYFVPVQVTVGRDQQGQPINADGNVPIDAKTIKEAFENVETAAMAGARRIQSEAREQIQKSQSRLIVPGNNGLS